jgi:hypothetical protein
MVLYTDSGQLRCGIIRQLRCGMTGGSNLSSLVSQKVDELIPRRLGVADHLLHTLPQDATALQAPPDFLHYMEAELFFVTHLFLHRADAMAPRSSGITYLAIPRSASRTPCDWHPSQILVWQHRQNNVENVEWAQFFVDIL